MPEDIKNKIYNFIKDSEGWVNLDDLVEHFKLDRKSVNYIVRMMVKSKQQSEQFPGVKVSSKRNNKPMTFGGQQATYDIKYKVEL